jgi:hypothetical protein
MDGCPEELAFDGKLRFAIIQKMMNGQKVVYACPMAHSEVLNSSG